MPLTPEARTPGGGAGLAAGRTPATQRSQWSLKTDPPARQMYGGSWPAP
jgi:hypothetical protein